MNKCKKCNEELVTIPISEILKDKNIKDFWCKNCRKYFEKNEIKIEPDYVTLCPYCKNYLADCGYNYCCYCGKELKDDLIKEVI